jgi:hypothetical protein
MVPELLPLREDAQRETWNVAVAGALQDDDRQGAVVEAGSLADAHRARLEVRVRIGVLDNRGHALDPLSVDLGNEAGMGPPVLGPEAAQRPECEESRPDARLQRRALVHPAGRLGIQSDAARRDEVAAVHVPEVDLPRGEPVGQREQVLGGVDDVAGDAERSTEDVRAAAGKDGQRNAGVGETVCRLVDGAVATEGDDQIEPVRAAVPDQVGRVVGCLGLDRLDLVAAPKCVLDQILQPRRYGGRLRIDDQQHSKLGGGALPALPCRFRPLLDGPGFGGGAVGSHRLPHARRLWFNTVAVRPLLRLEATPVAVTEASPCGSLRSIASGKRGPR